MGMLLAALLGSAVIIGTGLFEPPVDNAVLKNNLNQGHLKNLHQSLLLHRKQARSACRRGNRPEPALKRNLSRQQGIKVPMTPHCFCITPCWLYAC